MNTLSKMVVTSLIAVGGIAGCSSTPVARDEYRYASVAEYGRVTDIERVWVDGGGRSTGAGAVVGGIIGGVIGHQVGSGRGNDAATVAGAVGGAVVGNEIEKNRAGGREIFRVSVRMEGGGFRAFEQDSLANVRVGDNVRIVNGQVTRG